MQNINRERDIRRVAGPPRRFAVENSQSLTVAAINLVNGGESLFQETGLRLHFLDGFECHRFVGTFLSSVATADPGSLLPKRRSAMPVTAPPRAKRYGRREKERRA